MSRILLEICVDDAAGLAAARAGGADRIELCAALGLGGLTPSAGLMALAGDCGLPVLAMIRPRAGDFVWSPEERAAMRAEIAAARAAGLAGVVIGASLPDGRLDEEVLAEQVAAAEGMDVTLHRAIDLTPGPVAAMRATARLGIRRVLSSGGARTALEGLARLRAMADAAPEVTVMPGGGVSAANAARFAAALPLSEIHASGSAPQPAPTLSQIAEFGFQPPGARATDQGAVRALRQALDQIGTSRPSG
ncbi:copper homeostasis protein CutC [Paracoccus xiamenensis]|uniref:copper homeostasis protein CutC n=1 Tax=Paracoccus xiamenensis TaxID=2714901 RepID=UPI001408D2C3|nr:copper homeostasis protein CutC [Paracoccus xiamenensis]NHF73280.1 copper homeostasis protein CutC [Paracoccus xiamenensis]